MTFFTLTGNPQYADAATRANGFVKRTQNLSSTTPGVYGGIAGSHPEQSEYGRDQHLNWAAKYFVDALLAEESLSAERGSAAPQPEWTAYATC